MRNEGSSNRGIAMNGHSHLSGGARRDITWDNLGPDTFVRTQQERQPGGDVRGVKYWRGGKKQRDEALNKLKRRMPIITIARISRHQQRRKKSGRTRSRAVRRIARSPET